MRQIEITMGNSSTRDFIQEIGYTDTGKLKIRNGKIEETQRSITAGSTITSKSRGAKWNRSRSLKERHSGLMVGRKRPTKLNAQLLRRWHHSAATQTSKERSPATQF